MRNICLTRKSKNLPPKPLAGRIATGAGPGEPLLRLKGKGVDVDNSCEPDRQVIRLAVVCGGDQAGLMLEGALAGKHHRHLRSGFVAGLN